MNRHQVFLKQLHPSGALSRMRSPRNKIPIFFVSTASVSCDTA
jgi:hypothetical protein